MLESARDAVTSTAATITAMATSVLPDSLQQDEDNSTEVQNAPDNDAMHRSVQDDTVLEREEAAVGDSVTASAAPAQVPPLSEELQADRPNVTEVGRDTSSGVSEPTVAAAHSEPLVESDTAVLSTLLESARDAVTSTAGDITAMVTDILPGSSQEEDGGFPEVQTVRNDAVDRMANDPSLQEDAELEHQETPIHAGSEEEQVSTLQPAESRPQPSVALSIHEEAPAAPEPDFEDSITPPPEIRNTKTDDRSNGDSEEFESSSDALINPPDNHQGAVLDSGDAVNRDESAPSVPGDMLAASPEAKPSEDQLDEAGPPSEESEHAGERVEADEHAQLSASAVAQDDHTLEHIEAQQPEKLPEDAVPTPAHPVTPEQTAAPVSIATSPIPGLPSGFPSRGMDIPVERVAEERHSASHRPATEPSLQETQPLSLMNAILQAGPGPSPAEDPRSVSKLITDDLEGHTSGPSDSVSQPKRADDGENVHEYAQDAGDGLVTAGPKIKPELTEEPLADTARLTEHSQQDARPHGDAQEGADEQPAVHETLSTPEIPADVTTASGPSTEKHEPRASESALQTLVPDHLLAEIEARKEKLHTEADSESNTQHAPISEDQ
ncbi:hypothetical protein P389DRAFT_112471 [Cystobasidium minutum MCA 4210]|uniref:uncharacterized protein n=1 Tax=Cystobasidium minutum MCA 4210 TaxID=1397322 RepID=UPI0034CD0FF7|eukprot:jgi/Rhomi1/112471/CE112470_1877